MPRRPSDLRKHFGTLIVVPGMKTMRFRCCNYEETVSNATMNMSTHLRNCDKVPRSIGVLPILPIQNVDNRPSNYGELSAQAGVSVPSIESITTANTPNVQPVAMIKKLDGELQMLLAKALYNTGNSFSIFDHPSWAAFFAKFNPSWTLPSPEKIGDIYLMKFTRNACVTHLKELKRLKEG